MMCSIYWLTYALTHSEQRKQLFHINAGHNFVYICFKKCTMDTFPFPHIHLRDMYYYEL